MGLANPIFFTGLPPIHRRTIPSSFLPIFGNTGAGATEDPEYSDLLPEQNPRCDFIPMAIGSIANK